MRNDAQALHSALQLSIDRCTLGLAVWTVLEVAGYIGRAHPTLSMAGVI